MITPATEQAMCARALIGLLFMAVTALTLAAYSAGRRHGRRR